MAVDSITRPMVLTEEGCLRLIEAINEPVESIESTNKFEYGMKVMEEFFDRREKKMG